MVNHGRQEIVTNVSGALVGAVTTHHGHMPEIEITGDGTARGVWAMFDYVLYQDRPTGIKGAFIKRVSLSSTMGPGVKLELTSLA